MIEEERMEMKWPTMWQKVEDPSGKRWRPKWQRPKWQKVETQVAKGGAPKDEVENPGTKIHFRQPS